MVPYSWKSVVLPAAGAKIGKCFYIAAGKLKLAGLWDPGIKNPTEMSFNFPCPKFLWTLETVYNHFPSTLVKEKTFLNVLLPTQPLLE